MFKLLIGEREEFRISPVKILLYGYLGASYYWTKKIIVTNKRIVLSYQMFGKEVFDPSISFYYNKKDYAANGKFGDALIVKHKICVGKFQGKNLTLKLNRFMFFGVKIYGEKSLAIQKIIQKK